MKKLLILLLQIPFLTCSQHKPNPEAIQLNDSAVKLMMEPLVTGKGDSTILAKINTPAKNPVTTKHDKQDDLKTPVINDESQYEKAIDLLNKAIQIDSNYFIAYLNKMTAQTHLKQYRDAFISGKEMIRLRPNDGTVTYLVGMACERTGDTLTAKQYYNNALTGLQKVLASMTVNDKNYYNIKATKAADLVMLGRAREAQEIWQELYNAVNENQKWLYKMTWTRNDFLNESKSEDIETGILKK